MWGRFWTIILSSYTDEEISELNRWIKWYENEHPELIRKTRDIG